MQVRIPGNPLRFRVSRPEGSQPTGGGKALEIVLEKDEGGPHA